MNPEERYTVTKSWRVRSSFGMRTCRLLRDWKEHRRAAADKYWKRPKGSR